MLFELFLVFRLSRGQKQETLVENVFGELKDVCSPYPCHNGCQCQASCRDENSYYCAIPDNTPFMGKDCDWSLDMKCSSGVFVISIPQGFMLEMEQSVKTGFIQFCDAEDFLCEPDEKCMFEQKGGDFVFDMEQKPNCARVSVNSDGQEFFTSGVIVWDRLDTLIHMPRPMKRVTCSIDVLPAEGEIVPRPGSGNSISDPGVPNVNMTFWKTAYGVEPAVPATRGLIHKRVSYIISEVIHVRIQPNYHDLPHVVSKVRPNALTHEGITLHLHTCWLQRANSTDNRQYVIIENDHVVPNPIIPVFIENAPAYYRPVFTDRDREHNRREALAFRFQVAIFRNGDEMEINCNTRIEFGHHTWVDLDGHRRRRRDDERQLNEMTHAQTFDLDPANQSFFTYKNSTRHVQTSETGIPANFDAQTVQKLSPKSVINVSGPSWPINDRLFTTFLGVTFVFMTSALFYASWVFWYKHESPFPHFQLRTITNAYACRFDAGLAPNQEKPSLDPNAYLK